MHSEAAAPLGGPRCLTQGRPSSKPA